jgi:hypothetical protein
MKRFAYIADFSWWCLHRDGMGLVKYGTTDDARWEVLHFYDGECTPERLQEFDLIRFGSLPLYFEFEKAQLFEAEQHYVVTLASFRDAVLKVRDDEVEKLCRPDRACAIVINDNRMAPGVISLGKPVLYAPDKADHEVFKPFVHMRPAVGPLRLGWCGSEASWMGQKNVGILREAAERVDGLELVLQRREVEGCLSETEMVEWYNELDAYITVNVPETCTPIPILESALCGIPAISTRCGEAWNMAMIQIPELRVDALEKALRRLVRLGRPTIQAHGMQLGGVTRRMWSWETGEATRVTLAMEALCRDR